MRASEDLVNPIKIERATLRRRVSDVYVLGEGTNLRFVNSNGKQVVASPARVRISQEVKPDSTNGFKGLHRLEFFYSPGTGPRSGDSPNTQIFDNQSFILGLGTRQDGSVVGRKYEELSCIGFNYYSKFDDGVKYEMFTCLTGEPKEWDSSKMKLEALGVPLLKT